MDTAQWPQEIVVKPIDEIVANCGGVPPPPGSHGKALESQQQRKPRPLKEQALNCPRCNSTNTKFCYYNNYSLTQPRYFCKTCRRYWTEGGSLRSIPVGGGSRKNRRPNSSSSFSNSNTSSSTTTTTINTCSSSKIGQNPSKSTQDLNLSFPPELLHLVPNAGLEKGLMSSYLSMPLDHASLNYTTPVPPPGIFHNFQDMKPNLSFSLDGLGAYRNSLPDTSGGRMLFPFEELKVSSSTSIDVEEHQQQNNNGDHHQQQQQQGSDHHTSNGYWSGMLGGGSW